MFDANLENQLIIVDIAQAMVDYVSLQPDIDGQKAQAAAIVAQKIDIQRVIGKANVERCINPVSPADESLKSLVVPALCYFTYARMLKMFQGTFTDGGYVIDGEATERNVAKSTANEMSSIAEVFLKDVTDFLEIETPNDVAVDSKKINPRVRVFGGQESLASN